MKMENLEKRSSTDWSECGELPSMPKDAPQGAALSAVALLFLCDRCTSAEWHVGLRENHRAPLTWKLAERGL